MVVSPLSVPGIPRRGNQIEMAADPGAADAQLTAIFRDAHGIGHIGPLHHQCPAACLGIPLPFLTAEAVQVLTCFDIIISSFLSAFTLH